MPLLHMFYIYRHFFKLVTSNPSNDAIALVNNLYFRSSGRAVNYQWKIGLLLNGKLFQQ